MNGIANQSIFLNKKKVPMVSGPEITAKKVDLLKKLGKSVTGIAGRGSGSKFKEPVTKICSKET